MAAQVPTLIRLRRRAVLTCVATTVVIATVEIVIGWRFRLISIMAEGLHTAADLADSLVALFLVAMAARPADREHPYGHGKYDSLAGIVEGGCIALTGLWAIFTASRVLLGVTHADPRPEPAALIAMGVAAVVYLLVSRYVLRLARQTQSPAVYAEGQHLRTHVYIAAGLFAGLGVSRLGIHLEWAHVDRIDALAALVLGTFLTVVAYRVMRTGYRQLMDTALPASDMDEVTACLSRFADEFVEVHAIRSRRSGTQRHIDIHLVVEAEMSVRNAHDLSHRIEAAVRQCLPETELLVHVEPAVGAPLDAYRRRDGVGTVIQSEAAPTERESDHHEDAAAHRTGGGGSDA